MFSIKASTLLITLSAYSVLSFAQPDAVYTKNTAPAKKADTGAPSFKYIKTNSQGPNELEQELMQMFPELVKEKEVTYMYGKNAYRTKKVKVLDEEKLPHKMVALIKAQQTEIEKLKAEIAELKK